MSSDSQTKKRDRRYSAERRRRMRAGEDSLASERLQLAELILEERRRQVELRKEAVLLQGRLDVRDALLRELQACASVAALERSERTEDGDLCPAPWQSGMLGEVVSILGERYGDDVWKIVRLLERTDALHRTSLSPKLLGALMAVVRCPECPRSPTSRATPQVGLPYGLVVLMVPSHLPWASGLLTRIKAAYMTNVMLDPDCPVRHVSMLFPSDLERLMLEDPWNCRELASIKSSKVELPAAQLGLHEWRIVCRLAVRTFEKYRSPEERASPAFHKVICGVVAPLSRALTMRYFGTISGSNASIIREMRIFDCDTVDYDDFFEKFQLTDEQEDYILQLYAEMESVLFRIGSSMAASAQAVSHVGTQEGSRGLVAGAASRMEMLRLFDMAAEGSECIRQTIGWYGMRLQYVFSARQLCLAVAGAKRPLLTFEIVSAVVDRYRKRRGVAGLA